jgi:lipopolysaccharide/colanic/teichoic acid biosynthesis glycosyltransferase
VGGEDHVLGDRELRVGDGAPAGLGDAQHQPEVDVDLVALEEAERDHAPRPDSGLEVHESLEIVRTAHAGRSRPVYDTTKRGIDLLLAPLLLVVALPLIVVLALIVKLDSPGPALFRQTRVGKNGRLFTFYKFRTMYVDARERFPELYAYRYSEAERETMFFKLASDPRCTRVGRLLRRTSLDELPNVINVIRGDMACVGPRPEIPEMLAHYKPEQLVKFTVKPGLTGLAQISGRNLLTFQETIRHDLEYVRNRSLRFDLYVLARTPVVVVQMIGAL